MIVEIYLPYALLIVTASIMIGSFGGYLLGRAFKAGAIADSNLFNVLLQAEKKKREKLQADLNLEILNNKRLEDALEELIQKEADRKTYTELHKDRNKVLIDPESNKTKIPEKKIHKRRKLRKAQ